MVLIINLGVLASTKATDLQAVIDAIEDGKLQAKISVVISDKINAYALVRANKYDIDAIFIDPKSEDILEEEDKEKAEKAPPQRRGALAEIAVTRHPDRTAAPAPLSISRRSIDRCPEPPCYGRICKICERWASHQRCQVRPMAARSWSTSAGWILGP